MPDIHASQNIKILQAIIFNGQQGYSEVTLYSPLPLKIWCSLQVNMHEGMRTEINGKLSMTNISELPWTHWIGAESDIPNDSHELTYEWHFWVCLEPAYISAWCARDSDINLSHLLMHRKLGKLLVISGQNLMPHKFLPICIWTMILHYVAGLHWCRILPTMEFRFWVLSMQFCHCM